MVSQTALGASLISLPSTGYMNLQVLSLPGVTDLLTDFVAVTSTFAKAARLIASSLLRLACPPGLYKSLKIGRDFPPWQPKSSECCPRSCALFCGGNRGGIILLARDWGCVVTSMGQEEKATGN
jgi:hypothetical protein